MQFDGRGLKCPLAFVKAKQALTKDKTKVYLFDDDVSLYNFTSYLEKISQGYQLTHCTSWKRVELKAGTCWK
jgi:TusA-related sulfurtransferase